MSTFTRRSFIGKTAVALGSLAALQKVAGADLSRTDPGPANQILDGKTRIRCGRLPRTQKSWCRRSSIRTPLPTSVLMKADGHAR
jgi:hypothetical protein